MFIGEDALGKIQLGGAVFYAILSVAAAAVFALVFVKKSKVRAVVAVCTVVSLFLYILNPSVNLQFIFIDEWGDYYRSIPDLLITFVNIYAGVFLAVDLFRNKNISVLHIVFTAICLYQWIKIDTVLYSSLAENTFLNVVSKVGYAAFLALYTASIVYRWIIFFVAKTKINFRALPDFIFVFIVGFPSVIFSRLNLVFTDFRFVDFYGLFPAIGIKLFSPSYFFAIAYYICFSGIFCFYFYRFCKDKKGLVLKLLVAMLLTAYMRRATYFYRESFGLYVFLDSPCAFFPLAYLLYFVVKKTFFAHYVAFLMIPVSMCYVLFLISLNGFSSMFAYFTIDSFLFHICITPIALTVFHFEKFVKKKDWLYNLIFVSTVQVSYGLLGNIAGYLEYAKGYALNASDFYGFMYKHSALPIFEPLMHLLEYVKYGLHIHPFNYLIMAGIMCGLSFLGRFIFLKISLKIERGAAKTNGGESPDVI